VTSARRLMPEKERLDFMLFPFFAGSLWVDIAANQ
jgi:hypothetical protein